MRVTSSSSSSMPSSAADACEGFSSRVMMAKRESLTVKFVSAKNGSSVRGAKKSLCK